jgi:hypothetical protein
LVANRKWCYDKKDNPKKEKQTDILSSR